ncbi:molybdopterin synthase [Candidatus Halobonum tyrrellensis]|uniref:Bifunctional molybdopterin-guanine dinucleotide biosynthesis protein MobB/MoaE n=1 Tax=Candidatus Halobonum tyrrellensis G22 TaxID=1324957 RepID=V4HBC2_9EURY|nr:molybdopterin synthase [Candidatus Halobonum tyrrellensis]ESP87328.1 bifunctional molybdopterin-guanine dinucleotide biosynthesis protein MobB/MoaE [Candidatus Halobonum tyrrellensis G22]
MQALSVVGPGTGPLLDPLAARLDGRVATVRRDESAAPDTAAGPADAAFDLSPDGGWRASGTDDSFDALLDRLAPEYDYALVAGFSRLRLPTVVVGDREVAGDVLERVDDAAELDADALAARLDDAEPHVTLETLVDRVTASPEADRAGAIATFTGRVRAKDSPDDDRTTHLAFEKYEGVAADRMARIERELTDREGVLEVEMAHRVGIVPDGEDIVFVVVLAGHRREAFRAVEDGIDRLKAEVPIFKKETTTDEEFWVHDRA